MLWFQEFRFEYAGFDRKPFDVILETNQDREWNTIHAEISNDKIKISRRLSWVFRSGWGPVFSGAQIIDAGKNVIVGYFHPNKYLSVVILIMFAYTGADLAYQMFNAHGEIETRQLKNIGYTVGSVAFLWVVGLYSQYHIMDFIEASRHVAIRSGHESSRRLTRR